MMSALHQAVILAGGRGRRLMPLTDRLPKPMAPVNGRPFLDYLLQSLAQVGIRRVLLLLGYGAQVVIDHYRHAGVRDIEMGFAIGAIEDETGRRILNAHDALDDRFLLLYGDNYWPIEMPGMLRSYAATQALVSTTVFDNANGTGEYGTENNIEVADDGFVTRYDKTRRSGGLNGVDIGYFIVDKRCLDRTDSRNMSFEQHVLPELIAHKELAAYVTHQQYYYITDLESLRRFERVAVSHDLRPLGYEQERGGSPAPPYARCHG